jgi:hypothetical protein
MAATVKDYLRQGERHPLTQLGVGVVSRNVVDATIDLAVEHGVHLVLIASRRQVDMDDLGAGYVEGWDAHRLMDHVRSRGGEDWVLLGRDHGGPWQNPAENDLDVDAAMASSMCSFRDDIDAGFRFLHIDPSASPEGQPDDDVVLERMASLYQDCWEYASEVGADIAFEVGPEEQASIHSSMERPRRMLTMLRDLCTTENLPSPTYAVVQTGTLVMERRNVGSIDVPYRVKGQPPSEVFLPEVLRMLDSFGVHLKQHNTDYLSSEILRWHPLLGIHAANVAPEYGVIETLTLLEVLESRGLDHLVDRFLRVAYDTRKWEKWMIEGTSASDRDRAVIAGHYAFSLPEVREIKNEADRLISSRDDTTTDDLLRAGVRESLLRYLRAFRLVGC